MSRVTLDRLVDHRLQVARDPAIEVPQPRRIPSLDQADQPGAVHLVVRRAEGQELVEGQAQRVDVAAGVIPSLERLGRHVAQGAQEIAGAGEILLVGDLGQAKVGDPHGPLVVQQQVRGFDIAVDHPLAMGIGQRPGCLRAIRAASRALKPAGGRPVPTAAVAAAGAFKTASSPRPAMYCMT